MPRVYLTAAERDDAREKQKQDAMLRQLADGLAAYRNRKGLTKEKLGLEFGISKPTVVKLLSCQPTSLRTDSLHKIFSAAGINIVGGQSQ